MLVLMGLGVALAASGMSISGLGIRGVMGRIGGRRGLGVGDGRLLVLDRRLLVVDSRMFGTIVGVVNLDGLFVSDSAFLGAGGCFSCASCTFLAWVFVLFGGLERGKQESK